MNSNPHLHIDVELGRTIGLIGDLHSDLAALMKIEEENPDVDDWFLLGDVIDMSKPQHANDPIARFASTYPKFTAIKGNHETAVLKTPGSCLGFDERKAVQEWPLFLTITFGEHILKAAHQEEHITYPEEADMLAFGHTHRFQLDQQDSVWRINPGVSDLKGQWIRIDTDPFKISEIPVTRHP